MKSRIIKDYKKTINQEQIYIYMYEKIPKTKIID